MTLPPARGRRRRLTWLLLLYLLVLIAGAVALWLLIPQEVKKAIYETYVSP
jgi:hypothetical protein